MKIDKKLLVPVAMLSIVVFAGSVYAFTALTATTTLNVKEALSVTSITPGGDLKGLACTIAADSLTATCTGDVFPADLGNILVAILNSGHESITVTPGAVSSDPDVTVTAPSSLALPGGADTGFDFGIVILQGAARGTTATITMTFDR